MWSMTVCLFVAGHICYVSTSLVQVGGEVRGDG